MSYELYSILAKLCKFTKTLCNCKYFGTFSSQICIFGLTKQKMNSYNGVFPNRLSGCPCDVQCVDYKPINKDTPGYPEVVPVTSSTFHWFRSIDALN